jgi:hypothetical protein
MGRRVHDQCLLHQDTLNVGVLELGAIVTSHSFDLHIKLILGSCSKLLEYFMNFALVLHKEYPSVPRVVINNDKSIFVPSIANISHGTKDIHVK